MPAGCSRVLLGAGRARIRHQLVVGLLAVPRGIPAGSVVDGTRRCRARSPGSRAGVWWPAGCQGQASRCPASLWPWLAGGGPATTAPVVLSASMSACCGCCACVGCSSRRNCHRPGWLMTRSGDAKPCRRADPVPGPAGRGPAGGDIAAGRARGQGPIRGAWPGDPDRAAGPGAAAGLGAAGGAACAGRRAGGSGPRALRRGRGRAAAGQARGAPPRQPAGGHRASERAAWAAPGHAARGCAAGGRGHDGAVAAARRGRGDRADAVDRTAAARRRDTGRPGARDPARLRPGPVCRGCG